MDCADSPVCAHVGRSKQQSIGFPSNFDLHVMFPLSNPDFMEKTVRVEFQRFPLTIERVEPQGAVTAVNGGPNFVEVSRPAYVGLRVLQQAQPSHALAALMPPPSPHIPPIVISCLNTVRIHWAAREKLVAT